MKESKHIEKTNNNNIEFKTKLINEYAKELNYSDINKVKIRILYKDKKILKYIGLHKKYYRSYSLEMIYNDFFKKTAITFHQKDEIKVKFRTIKKIDIKNYEISLNLI